MNHFLNWCVLNGTIQKKLKIILKCGTGHQYCSLVNRFHQTPQEHIDYDQIIQFDVEITIVVFSYILVINCKQ